MEKATPQERRLANGFMNMAEPILEQMGDDGIRSVVVRMTTRGNIPVKVTVESPGERRVQLWKNDEGERLALLLHE